METSFLIILIICYRSLSFLCLRMEAFSHAAGNLLKEFSALLNQSPTPITSTRLLQLMAINMFAVENTDIKGTDSKRNVEVSGPLEVT